MTEKRTIAAAFAETIFEKPPVLRMYFIAAAFAISLLSLLPLCLIFSPDEIFFITINSPINEVEVTLQHLLSDVRFSSDIMLKNDAAMYVFGAGAADALSSLIKYLKYVLFIMIPAGFILNFFSSRIRFIQMPSLKIKASFFIPCAAIGFALFSYYAGHVLKNNIPIINDELAQLFHAKALADGKWFHSSIINSDFFNITFTFVKDGKWISQYPPGNIILLAAGIIAGNPAAVIPILAGLTIIAVYLLGKILFGEKPALAAAAVYMFLPMFIKASFTYMNTIGSGAAAALFYLFFIRAVTDKKTRDFLLCGAAAGMLFIIRPYTAVAVGFPYALYLIYDCFIRRETLIRCGMICFAGFASIAWFYFYFNYVTTGNPLLSGYEALWGTAHRPGFGENPWGKDHTFFKGLLNLNNTFIDMNVFMTGWPVPFLITLIPAVYFLHKDAGRKLFFIFAPVISLLIFNIFYFYYEARLVYETLPLLIPAAVYGIYSFFGMGGIKGFSGLRKQYATPVIIFFALSSLYINYSTLTSLPKNTAPFLLEKMQSYGMTNALVFMNSNYQSVEILVPFSDDAPVIYARDLGPRNKELIEQYPHRKVYFERDGKITKAD